MNFILLINVKLPTIVGILTFISMMNKNNWEFDDDELEFNDASTLLGH